jgi:hypothetical protein
MVCGKRHRGAGRAHQQLMLAPDLQADVLPVFESSCGGDAPPCAHSWEVSAWWSLQSIGTPTFCHECERHKVGRDYFRADPTAQVVEAPTDQELRSVVQFHDLPARKTELGLAFWWRGWQESHGVYLV